MASYIKSLNRNESIREAKHKLNDFSDLYKLLSSGISLPSSSNWSDFKSGSTYLNHSLKQLEEIETKDERLREIEEVLHAIDRLDDELGELLFLRHIMMYKVKKIADLTNKSTATLYNELNRSYFDIAVILRIGIKELEK